MPKMLSFHGKDTFWKQNGLLIWIINETVTPVWDTTQTWNCISYLNSGSSFWTPLTVKNKAQIHLTLQDSLGCLCIY